MNTVFKSFLLLGALVVSAAAAAAGGKVYVPLGSTGEVLVVDSDKDRIIARIPGLPDVHGLAGVSGGSLLVAGSYSETPRAKAAVPDKPAGMSSDEHEAHHAKPKTGATAPSDAIGYVSIVEAKTGRVLRRVEVPGAVHHVETTPDGRYAVATLPNAGGISVIDLSNYAVVAMVATGPEPNYVVASTDGRRLYVSNAGNGTVSEVDTERWIVRRNFIAGETPEHLVVARDGRTLYVNNVDDGTVSEISTVTGEQVRRFDIGGGLHGIDLSDDGLTLFVAARERGRIAAVDLKSGAVRFAPLAPAPYHLAAVPGTGKLYVSSADEPKMWVVDQKTLAVIGEVPVGGRGHQMVVGG